MTGAVPAGRKRFLEKRSVVRFLLWALVGMAVLGWGTYRFLEGWVLEMGRVGWWKHLGAESAPAFFLLCLNQTACTQVLFKPVPLGFDGVYYAYALWLLLGALLFLRPKTASVALRYGQHFATEAEIKPLVETRKPEEITDSGLRPLEERKNDLMGYLGVWMGSEFSQRHKEPKRPLFLRLPARIERIHTITYAGTGGGKTVGIFRPRIALDAAEGNIAIVFDTKYPNPGDSYLDVRDWFRAFGRRVWIIDPFGFERGEEAIQLPVLEGIRDFPSALDAARLIYPPDIENADAASRVFVANARTLLAGILYALALDPNETPSFKRAADIANMDTASLQAWFKPHNEARAAIQSTLGADKYVLSGAQNRLVTDLEIFQMDSADELFRKGPRAVRVEDILLTPGMVHLVFPERFMRGSAGRAVLRFFKRFFDQKILEMVERIGGPLPVHVNYYYDELALFGFLPDLDSDLATLRSRNISVHMATQSRAQMEAIYGERWEATENNNIGTFYLVPGSYTPEEAQYWSRMLGRFSFVSSTLSQAVSGDRKSEGVSFSERERELVTPDEMMTMGIGEMIVLVRGFHPILVRSYPVEDKRSPVYWVHERVAVYRESVIRKRLEEIFSDPLPIEDRPHRHPPSGIADVYRAFESLIVELGSLSAQAVYRSQGDRWDLILDYGDLERAGLHPEMLEALERYYFLQRGERGVVIRNFCPYGDNRVRALVRNSGLRIVVEN